MEALAAVALAGNILQFVQYAGQLISTGNEVYNSTTGSSGRNTELEKVYKTLYDFTTSLQRETQSTTLGHSAHFHSPKNLEHIQALQSLSQDCKTVCDQLLEKVRKLALEDGRWRRCTSFRAALKAVWSERSISELESRLDRFQKTISLHFFAIISNQQSSLLDLTTTLKRESHDLKVDHNSKFNEISSTLAALSSNLERLTKTVPANPTTLGHCPIGVASGDVLGSDGASSLASRMERLSLDISRLALTEHNLEDVRKEQTILRSLHFYSRRVRHDNIPLAHEKTFRWMLEYKHGDEQDDEEEIGPQFREWLSSGDGIFWISGKPGSGKSTLMKYLADHERTEELLEEWAQGSKLVLVPHYFWSAGTPMQKSLEGLYRTFLYKIFRTSPVLIRQVCPNRWEETNAKRNEGSDWTVSELLEAFRKVSRIEEVPAKYCLFVDGIDEFDGDHYELCEVLIELSKVSNIKLCLASRPWNVFLDSFGEISAHVVRLEDLTRHDIQRYTKSRLEEHHRLKFWSSQRKNKESVVEYITDKARGVFLWVFLVTRSLRDGLTNGDTMLQVRQRLESLPTDLEHFFKHILNQVDSIYHTQMTITLRVAVNAKQPLPVLVYAMLEQEFEDVDYAVRMPVTPLSSEEREALTNDIGRRINARCGGLLEVKSNSVEFLHRTVRDFVFTPEMGVYLESRTFPGFSANVSTFRAYLAICKTQVPYPPYASIPYPQLLRDTLKFVPYAFEESEESAMELTAALESTCLSINTPQYAFRTGILEAGLDIYICMKLCNDPCYFDDLEEPPLMTVIKTQGMTSRHIGTIGHLLRYKEDPNKNRKVKFETSLPDESSSVSPWNIFMKLISVHDDLFIAALERGVIPVFVKYGADLNTLIESGAHHRAIRPCTRFIRKLFSPKLEINLVVQEKSLNALDAFFDLDHGWVPPSRRVHFGEVLFELQEKINMFDTGTPKLEKLKFFAQITQKFVNYGYSLDRDLKTLPLDIEKAFPPDLAASILEYDKKDEYDEYDDALEQSATEGSAADSKRAVEDELMDVNGLPRKRSRYQYMGTLRD